VGRLSHVSHAARACLMEWWWVWLTRGVGRQGGWLGSVDVTHASPTKWGMSPCRCGCADTQHLQVWCSFLVILGGGLTVMWTLPLSANRPASVCLCSGCPQRLCQWQPCLLCSSAAAQPRWKVGVCLLLVVLPSLSWFLQALVCPGH
jgi:hypothetical protein